MHSKDIIHILTCLMIIFILPYSGLADDAVYLGDATDVYPIEHTGIQLVSETIIITDRHAFQIGINKDYHLRWLVKVDMVFKKTMERQLLYKWGFFYTAEHIVMAL